MKPTRSYPRLHVDAAPSNAFGQAGGMLLTESVHTSGIGHYLKQALAAWKKPFATHDPAKILAADADEASAAINTARAAVRARVWELSGLRRRTTTVMLVLR